MRYTQEDIPLLLNNISWQLKRIADSLEHDAQTKLAWSIPQRTGPNQARPRGLMLLLVQPRDVLRRPTSRP